MCESIKHIHNKKIFITIKLLVKQPTPIDLNNLPPNNVSKPKGVSYPWQPRIMEEENVNNSRKRSLFLLQLLKSGGWFEFENSECCAEDQGCCFYDMYCSTDEWWSNDTIRAFAVLFQHCNHGGNKVYVDCDIKPQKSVQQNVVVIERLEYITSFLE